MYNYINTIYQGYHIKSSTIGKIKYNDNVDEYLLIARDNILQIHDKKNSTLKLMNEIEIYENIIMIKRLSNNILSSNIDSDYYFILTNNLNYCFCKLDNGLLNVYFHGSASPSSSPSSLTSKDIIGQTQLIKGQIGESKNPLLSLSMNGSLGSGGTNINNVISQQSKKNISTKELDEIKVATDTDGFDENYIIISAYENKLYYITYKIKLSGELQINKYQYALVEYDDILDIVAFDRKNYKTINMVLGILYKNNHQHDKSPYFNLIEINISNGEILKKNYWSMQFHNDPSVYKIINLCDGGLITFSEVAMRLYKPNEQIPCSEISTSIIISAIERIPNFYDFFIISNNNDGGLYLLSRGQKDKTESVSSLNSGLKKIFKINPNILILKYLGRSSSASTLTYIQPRHLFVGSEFDDSYLIKILDVFTNFIDDPYIEKVYNIKHLGYVSDIQIIQRTGGKRSILTASDLKLKDQINIFNRGIEIKLESDLSNLNKFWFKNLKNLHTVYLKTLNKYYVIVSKPSNTCIFGFGNNNIMYTINVKDFNINETTIYAKEIDNNSFIHITKTCIYLIAYNDNMMDDSELYISDKIEISNNDSHKILMADSYGQNIVIASNKGQTQLLCINDGKLKIKTKILIESQISALSMNNNYIGITFWNSSFIRIYDKNSLSEVYQIELNKSGIKSLKFIDFDINNNYIICGMYDGTLYVIHYALNTNLSSTLSLNTDKKPITIKYINYILIGSTPLSIQLIHYMNKKYIFIGCDNPILINQNKLNNTLQIINTNIKYDNINSNSNPNINNICTINIKNKEYLLTLIENNLYLATFDMNTIIDNHNDFNDKILNKSLPLNIKEYSHYICYISDYDIYVISTNYLNEAYTEGYSYINLYDSISYSKITSIQLKDNEILCMKDIVIQDKRYLLIGGRYISIKKGFLNMYKILNDTLNIIQSKNYDKYVIDIDLLLNEYVTIAFGSSIKINKIKTQENIDYTYSSNNKFIQDNITIEEILTKNVDTAFMKMTCYQNMILCVDSLKGIGLYMYNKDDNKLVKIGSSMKFSHGEDEIGYIIDENNMLIAGGEKIKIMRRNKHGDHESERLGFQTNSIINLNDTITCMKREKVVLFDNSTKDNNQSITNEDNSIMPTSALDYVIYGTAKGNIGNIILLPEKTFSLLKELQECILSEIIDTNSFGFDYKNWRSYMDKQLHEKVESVGFIDGNILKKFLGYSEKKMRQMIEKISIINKPLLDDVRYLIEKLNKFI